MAAVVPLFFPQYKPDVHAVPEAHQVPNDQDVAGQVRAVEAQGGQGAQQGQAQAEPQDVAVAQALGDPEISQGFSVEIVHL